MKKTRLLNSDISRAISEMGHTDRIAVVDAGFPIPANVRRIDLCLEKGTPNLLQTVDVVLSELEIQAAFLAEETRHQNLSIHDGILHKVGDARIHYVSHEAFKDLVRAQVAVVIRTGEASQYANVVLEAGVTF